LKKRTLRVHVVSAFKLPPEGTGDDVLDPYVKIEMHGIPGDIHKEKTKTISNNGYNPVWDKAFDFTVRCPELAFLVFEVYDHDMATRDNMICHESVRVSLLREGYRTLPLLRDSAEPFPSSSLLVHFSWL